MKCVTLTLNPAFDRHCFVEGFSLYREHLASADTCEAGGKGVNISRALHSCGYDSLAVVVTGDENGAHFLSCLENDGLRVVGVSIRGRIRENLTVHTDNAPETRISFAGFSADDGLLERVYDLIEGELCGDTVLTLTGRLPSGVSMGATVRFLERVRETGARVVIDSKSFETLEELIAAKPWLIKPNEEEISEYLGRCVSTHGEIADVARNIRERGVENVMVSLGEKGAMLVCAEGAYICRPPKIEARSTVGAGDSSIGGFIAATVDGLAPCEALRRAVAFGSAACLREGTLPPLPKDVDRMLRETCIEII